MGWNSTTNLPEARWTDQYQLLCPCQTPLCQCHQGYGQEEREALKASAVYKVLVRIGAIYDLEGTLKNLSLKERLKERQTSIRPLVEEYFSQIEDSFKQGLVLPKSKTAKGFAYSINQEKYLKVFLLDGEVPIDDSTLERALRNFTISRKNWMIINTVRGAQASAGIYSITETARTNGLNVYYYIKYLLEQLTALIDEQGNIEQSNRNHSCHGQEPCSLIVTVSIVTKRRLLSQKVVRFDPYG